VLTQGYHTATAAGRTYLAAERAGVERVLTAMEPVLELA
jgi:hypothetical protein